MGGGDTPIHDHYGDALTCIPPFSRTNPALLGYLIKTGPLYITLQQRHALYRYDLQTKPHHPGLFITVLHIILIYFVQACFDAVNKCVDYLDAFKEYESLELNVRTIGVYF